MSIKVKVKNNIKTKTQNAISMYENNARRHLNRVANEFKNKIQLSMVNTPKLGSVREDGHVASIAPNPPAVDTGILSGSIRVKPALRDLVATVLTDVDYAARLQLVLQRNFMGKGAPARKDVTAFSKKMLKDMKIGKARIR